jgi:SpoVK/Ycf46/Vps4 family AAA+-type ATPase
MNIELIDIVSYLTIGLVAYYFLQEAFKEKSSWLSWLFIGGIILVVGYVIWSNHQQSKNLSRKSSNTDQLSDEEDFEIESDDFLPENYVQEVYTPQRKNFQLVNASNNPTNSVGITYQQFKLWYLSPQFIEKYTDSLREALKIKRKRLLKARRNCIADLKAIQRTQKPKNGLASILREMNNTDDAKTIQSTIDEMAELVRDIDQRRSNITIEQVRMSLISAVSDRQCGIESLTGRDDIKNFLAEKLYTFAHNPRVFFTNFQNMAIYGPSGIGKTKLAKVIGHVYAASGILVRNHVHVVTKQALTTAYVDESGRKTRKLLLANLESVVFIDEAYDMTPPDTAMGKGIDHGQEAIAEMVNFIDKMIGLSIIIVSGYEKEMKERFMNANEGLDRRFPCKLILQPYNTEELTNIAIKFILESNPGLQFNEKVANYLFTLIQSIDDTHPEFFEHQAGDMQNLSGFISESLTGRNWPEDHEQIIMAGVNKYLSSHGVGLIEGNSY